jgi:small-conductance mechanosensitive channel
MMRHYVLQFLSRPFVVGDRIHIMSGSGAKFATGFVERVDPIYTILRTDTGLPVTIPNKVAMVFRYAPARELETFGE